MFERWAEGGLLDVLEEAGIGCIAFSPLAQGLLTNKYLGGIPADSRVAKAHGALNASQITHEKMKQVEALNQLAISRGQSLAQMAIAWLLKDNRVTSVLVGASSVSQLDDSLQSLKSVRFTADELLKIEIILKQ
jgi:L-glyceraldehyde 3-phosphate reductase